MLLALVVALALQTTLSGLTISGARDGRTWSLVAVVYVALAFGPVTGLWPARPAAWSRTPWPAASSASAASRRRSSGSWPGARGAVHRRAAVPRFVMFVGATVLHEVCFQGLYALVEVAAVPAACVARC